MRVFSAVGNLAAAGVYRHIHGKLANVFEGYLYLVIFRNQ